VKSLFSLTSPRYLKHGVRAISTKHPFDAIPVWRARSRTASHYLLATDLSQFYPSISTHSIPWALHKKSVAKARPNDYSLLGNALVQEPGPVVGCAECVGNLMRELMLDDFRFATAQFTEVKEQQPSARLAARCPSYHWRKRSFTRRHESA